MGFMAFSDYIASRSEATVPVGTSDRIMILQDGVVKLVASADTGQAGVSTVLIDATITPVTTLPASGEIVYVKSDASATVANFQVLVVGQTMCQALQNGLEGEGSHIRVKLIGSNWYETT